MRQHSVEEGSLRELSKDEALLEPAARLAVDLDHPAHDCMYLALAHATGRKFVTADERLLRKLRQARRPQAVRNVLSLADAAAA
jgi:predicted nucleic acid-binding protein